MSLSRKKKLIDIVELNPDLWKLTKKAPNLKQNLWNVVGSQIGTSGFDARRQWEILRDQFRREYKRFTCDRTYKSKWIFYNRMLFMRHALRTRDGLARQSCSDNDEHGSEQPLEIANQIVDDKWNIQSEMDDVPKIQVRQDLQGSTDSSHSQATIYKGIEAKPSTSAGVSSTCQRPRYGDMDYSSARRRRRWRTESTDDEDYHFVMSILPSLRSIQHTKKLRVRSKIMEIIATELDAGNQVQLALHAQIGADNEAEDKFRLENSVDFFS